MFNKRLAIISGVALAVFLTGLGAYSVINSVLHKEEEPVVELQLPEELPVGTELEISEENNAAFIAPLTGLAVAKPVTSRPLVISIGNNTPERPQSGLREADVVYELLAEGGITRFLAVYQQGEAENVGPIRSARDYLAFLAHDFDGVFVHIGGSPGGLAHVQQSSVANLDAFYIGTGEFWRTKDRKPPYNLYGKTSGIRRLIEKRGLAKEINVSAWPFLKPGEELPGGSASDSIKILYPQAFSVVEYNYVPELNLYARSMGGKPHLDRETDLQLTARNIIVQYANTKVIDGEGRLDIQVVGTGKALAFTGGQAYEAIWKKGDKRSRTIFTTSQGEEIPLNPGQTWIQIVRTGTDVVY